MCLCQSQNKKRSTNVQIMDQDSAPPTIDRTRINENVSQIKSEYLEHIQKLTDSIKPENLSKFCANDKNKEITIALDSFKNELNTSITSQFDRAWNFLEIDDSLSCIEAMNKLSSTKDTNAWRPSGKSVLEQTKCYRIQMQKIQISYFEQKIKKQNETLEKLFIELEKKRQCMDDIVKKRKFLQTQMNERKQQFIDSEENMIRLLYKLENIPYNDGGDNVTSSVSSIE